MRAKENNTPGSVTIMMTLVLLIVTSLLLVTLEHAYVFAGKTLVWQTLNKAAESAMGLYYAPLYTEYGLFALPIGDGLSYADMGNLEDEITGTFGVVFAGEHSKEDENFFWNASINYCKVDAETYFVDEAGKIFSEQVCSAVTYDMLPEITGALKQLSNYDLSDIKGLLSGVQDQIDDANEDTKNDGSTEDADDEKEENYSKEEAGAKEVYDTLVTFLQDGFSGWWFEDSTKLSKTMVDTDELVSTEYFGENVTSELFEEPDFKDLMFDDGSYLDELIEDTFVDKFVDAVKTGLDKSSSKVKLTTYSAMNMDSYLKDNIKGKLSYEQEYLIFGSPSDEGNVKKMGWSIFGIRFLANLLFLLSDESAKGQIEEWISTITSISKWITLIKVIASVVLAAENAIVETAAIFQGKRVDFIVTGTSQTVGISEIFTLTKSSIQEKAQNYQGESSLQLSYQTYLFLFMLMTNTEKLTYRMMDVIQLNMQEIYNENFEMEDCLVGFSVELRCNMPAVFTGLDLYLGVGKSYSHAVTAETAIMY